jgi:hypothetical protein
MGELPLPLSSPRKRGPMDGGTYRFQYAFTVGSRFRGNDDWGWVHLIAV